MKTYKFLIIAFVILISTAHSAEFVTQENTWTESYPVNSSSPQLLIRNIWGSVQVRSGIAGEISVSVTELRSAPDQERFERSLDEIRLDVVADTGGVSLVVGDPEETRRHVNDCYGCRVDYQFEVRVPSGTIVDVATVVDGRVDVRGITGTISASNVNGPIRIDDLNDCESVVSVNGSVKLVFAQAPVLDCNIETINGDITLGVPSGAGLDVMLDLFNGDIASELKAGPYPLPATVEHTVKNGHNQYRIQKMTGVRLGPGGPQFSIASINGDVRIQKH